MVNAIMILGLFGSPAVRIGVVTVVLLSTLCLIAVLGYVAYVTCVKLLKGNK